MNILVTENLQECNFRLLDKKKYKIVVPHLIIADPPKKKYIGTSESVSNLKFYKLKCIILFLANQNKEKHIC